MDPGNDNTWRSGVTLEYRQTLVDSILATIHNHMPPTSEEIVTETLAVARTFEELVFYSASDLDSYLQRIFTKEQELLEKHHAAARQDLELIHLEEQLMLDFQHQHDRHQLLQQQNLEKEVETNALFDLQYQQELQRTIAAAAEARSPE